ncbi:MAG: PilW family protein [Patescibacteria group bacterium]
MKYKAHNKGFTLVEVLVASAIFVTTTVLVADIFVRTNDTQRKTQAIQETATDARFAFEAVSREARLGEIDYDYYSGSIDVAGESELALRNTQSDPIRFGLQTTGCPSGSTSCLSVCIQETCTGSDWVPLSPSGIEVTSLNFLIQPDQSPFEVTGSDTYNNNIQPRITIIMTTENTTSDARELATFTMQTTVSSRFYRR